MFFFFCVLHIFQNFPCTLGEDSKSVSFLRVYVCVKAKLTLVSFFFPFFSMHLSHNTMLYSVALRYLVDESIYMHQVHVNISITGCGNRYLSICTLMIAHYCTLSLSAIWMAKMWATWHLKYRIQCRCTLSPCQPSSQYRIQCITGGAFRRLPQLGSLALQNNDIAGS